MLDAELESLQIKEYSRVYIRGIIQISFIQYIANVQVKRCQSNTGWRKCSFESERHNFENIINWNFNLHMKETQIKPYFEINYS